MSSPAHPASVGSSNVTTASYQAGSDNPAAISSQPTAEEVEAAIKIQKVVRGHLSRRNSEKLRSGFNSASPSPRHSRTPSTATASTSTSTSQSAKPATSDSSASSTASSAVSSVTGAAQSAWTYVSSLPPTTLAIAGVAVASVAYVLFVANKPNQFSATVTRRV